MTARSGVAWRYAALAGLAAGLAIAPAAAHAPVEPALLLALACLLAVVRPRGRAVAPWLVLVAGVAILAGLTLGDARIAAIDAGALTPDNGERLRARGTVVSTPRVASGVAGFVLEVDGKRIAVRAARAFPMSTRAAWWWSTGRLAHPRRGWPEGSRATAPPWSSTPTKCMPPALCAEAFEVPWTA